MLNNVTYVLLYFIPLLFRQLLLINSSCTTPEKMAIVLLDYLFPQEVQAVSNLSGKGRHCKKQLDPLKVFYSLKDVSKKYR